MAIFKDQGSRKPTSKLMAHMVSLLMKRDVAPFTAANKWPFDDEEFGPETEEVLAAAIEKGNQEKPMYAGIDAAAADKIFGSRIQVYLEEISVVLGGAVVTSKKRGENEVLRRLAVSKTQDSLRRTTADVRRTLMNSAQAARDEGTKSSIEETLRAKTPEEDEVTLKDDIETLSAAIIAEPTMLVALSKIERPKTLMSWNRALALVRIAAAAVKDVPTKEAEEKDTELLLTFVEDAKQSVDLPALVSQVRVVMQIRQQLTAKSGLRPALRTLGQHANDLPRRVLGQILREMAEVQEPPIKKVLNDAADLADHSDKTVKYILRVAAAAIDPEVAKDLRRMAAEECKKPLVGLLVGAGLQKPEVIITDDTTDAMDIALVVKHSMDSIIEDVFDSMDAEDAEGGPVDKEPTTFVEAMQQLVHVKQKQLAHEVQANLEVERLKKEMELREAASADYMVKLKSAQQKQVEELLAHAEKEKAQHEATLEAVTTSAEARERNLQDELALTRRRAQQRSRLLEERMQRKDSTAAATYTQQKSLHEQMAKSYEAELARRRKEINHGEQRYNEDTTKYKAEVARLREKVAAQRSQISGISNDLTIYRKALMSFETSREKDHETIKTYRQSILLSKPPKFELPEDDNAEDFEPEIEPAEASDLPHAVVESKQPVDGGEKSPEYLDMLATLMTTQAALDRTQQQCDKQAELLRQLRHSPGTEQEIILKDKVATLEAQLEAATAAAVNANPFPVPFKGSTYQLSRFAPRTMRGQDEPARQSSVPSLPQV